MKSWSRPFYQFNSRLFFWTRSKVTSSQSWLTRKKFIYVRIIEGIQRVFTREKRVYSIPKIDVWREHTCIHPLHMSLCQLHRFLSEIYRKNTVWDTVWSSPAQLEIGLQSVGKLALISCMLVIVIETTNLAIRRIQSDQWLVMIAGECD